MAITEEELKKIIGVNFNIEKVTTLSSDGRNLLTRVPKEIRENLGLVKGMRIRWIIEGRKKKKIILEILKDDDQKKEKMS